MSAKTITAELSAQSMAIVLHGADTGPTPCETYCGDPTQLPLGLGAVSVQIARLFRRFRTRPHVLADMLSQLCESMDRLQVSCSCEGCARADAADLRALDLFTQATPTPRTGSTH